MMKYRSLDRDVTEPLSLGAALREEYTGIGVSLNMPWHSVQAAFQEGDSWIVSLVWSSMQAREVPDRTLTTQSGDQS